MFPQMIDTITKQIQLKINATTIWYVTTLL